MSMIVHGRMPLARSPRAAWLLLALLALALAFPRSAAAQQVAQAVVTVPRGQSALLTQPTPVQRVSIADPTVADAVVISPREVLVNGLALGTTTLIIWDQAGGRRIYAVEVTVDAPALERQVRTLFPGENIRVAVSGNIVILSGTVSTGAIARQVRELARGTGAQVVDNLTAPPPQQVLLEVRVAEVSRSVVQEMSTQLRALFDDAQGIDGRGTWDIESVSDGLLRVFLLDRTGAQLQALFRALRSTGDFRSLAEPNVLALDGSTASFLAGGEFPFPTVQSGAAAGSVTIVWKEFGVRLNFTPTITGAGNIRLQVAPEVSSLDFANALTIQGFVIPSLLTRRAETEIELRDGQTFAIAGLLDNTTLENVTRIPILGDLPILGAFFRSRNRRQNRTELLVLVTPRLVQPTEAPPAVPTGEPETWRWDRHIRRNVTRPPR